MRRLFDITGVIAGEAAVDDLGESCNATPAISDGEIFTRTHDNLICIGK